MSNNKTEKKKNLKKQILGVFKQYPERTLNYKIIAHNLSISAKHNRTKIIKILHALEAKGDIVEISKEKYKYNKIEQKYVDGVLEVTRTGNGFIISDEIDRDVFVASRHLNKSLHGDRVKVLLYPQRRKKRPEGEIVEILQRHQTNFAGKLQISDRHAFLIPDSPYMMVDIYLIDVDRNQMKDGMKAIAAITDWPDSAKNPFGKVVEVLGMPGDNDAEMSGILIEHGYSLKFPDEVLKEADAIPVEISEEEIKRRRDFREVVTLSIDPADAKDFDDALSLQILENGHYEVGVHIADVTYYVKPDSALDKTAFERSTSVYLVDRVLPMLPEKLSNIVCSLRPDEEKLCFSAVFELNEKGDVINEWFGRTVILSNKRFAYEEAQEVLNQGEGTYHEELNILNNLAKNLREKRFKQGGVEFETTEVRFKLDENKKPVGVYVKQVLETNELIEDFMLLANKRVAEYVSGYKAGEVINFPFIYRVHDLPDAEKMEDFRLMASGFGYQLKLDTPRQISRSLNRLIKEIKGKPEENVLQQMAIRTMAKAIYTTENIGHYGLGFKYYTHFTSPIRRYSDVLVHRLLDKRLRNEKGGIKDLGDKSVHISNMERSAMEAERESIKYKQVEYLQDKIGEVFEGVISGTIEWGFFVELVESKCEGAVRLANSTEDFYTYDSASRSFTGRHTGMRYKLGDKVWIRVKSVNMAKRQIDLEIAEPPIKEEEE